MNLTRFHFHTSAAVFTTLGHMDLEAEEGTPDFEHGKPINGMRYIEEVSSLNRAKGWDRDDSIRAYEAAHNTPWVCCDRHGEEDAYDNYTEQVWLDAMHGERTEEDFEEVRYPWRQLPLQGEVLTLSETDRTLGNQSPKPEQSLAETHPSRVARPDHMGGFLNGNRQSVRLTPGMRRLRTWINQQDRLKQPRRISRTRTGQPRRLTENTRLTRRNEHHTRDGHDWTTHLLTRIKRRRGTLTKKFGLTTLNSLTNYFGK